MGDAAATGPDQGTALLALYDVALPDVYGYLLRRCGSIAIAEDLTSETFVAAVDAVRRNRVPSLTMVWLIGVARHKLVDHWRRMERAQRLVDVIDRLHADDHFVREWASFDPVRAGDAIAVRHDGQTVCAPADGRVVFPNSKAAPGHEWFYFAQASDRVLA